MNNGFNQRRNILKLHQAKKRNSQGLKILISILSISIENCTNILTKNDAKYYENIQKNI